MILSLSKLKIYYKIHHYLKKALNKSKNNSFIEKLHENLNKKCADNLIYKYGLDIDSQFFI